MDRRNFLRLLTGAAIAAPLPLKSYSFLGKIFRGRADLKWGQTPLPPGFEAHLRAMQEAMIQSMLYGHSPAPWSGLEARYSTIDSGVKAGVEAGDWDNIVRIS